MASLPPGAFGAMLREDAAAGGETGAEAAALMDMLAELGADAGFPPGTTPLELEAILRGGRPRRRRRDRATARETRRAE